MVNQLTVQGIHPFDGYAGERFWEKPDNETTYNDPKVDNQCRVPLRPMIELLGDFVIKCAQENGTDVHMIRMHK